MLGRRSLYLVSLAGCFVFYLCYQEWFSWFALLGLLWLPWLSLALSLPAILTFQVRAEGPERLPMGTYGEVILVGGSRWPVPSFRGRLCLERKLTGETLRQHHSVQLSTAHCGAFDAVPEKTYVYDYLGLFRFKARKSQPLRIMVTPVPVKLREMPDLDRFLAQAWRPKAGGGYAENHELRQYRPGDSLNQIHWKLTAKTGKPIIREPMEPQRGMVLVTVDIKGTPAQLDRKFGQLLWLGLYLLQNGMPFALRALNGEGVQCWQVEDESGLQRAIETLLSGKTAGEGSVLDLSLSASWHCHIGGEPDEA